MRDPRLSDDELEAALLAVLDALGAEPAALDLDGRIAYFAAELSLRARAGEGSDPALDEALRSIPSAERRTWTVWELANACFDSGRLEQAELIGRYGLARQPAPTLAPRLWHVRSEAARLRGDWRLAEECLEHMDESIPAHAVYEGDPAKAALLAQNHQYRSRLLQARAQVWLELGLHDRCRDLAGEALQEAEQSGDLGAMVAARLLAIDLALIRGGSAAEAIELARAGCADERLSAAHHLFRLHEGRAEIEQAREAVLAGKDGAPAAARARAALASALAGNLPPTVQLDLELRLGDLELFTGHVAEARAHLGRARALAAELPPAAQSNETVLLAVLAWRLACTGETAGETASRELEQARGELFEAYRGFLQQWENTPRRPGGIGFLHVAWRAQVVSEVIEAELGRPGPLGVERAFERLLEAQAKGTLARERGLSAVATREVCAELLPAGRGLLVLLPARDRSHLFLLDRQGLVHERIPLGRDALRNEARKITAALQRRDGRVDPATLRGLHDALLPAAALERLRRWSGATTVGFDLLCDLPFGILAGEDGVPWGERLALDVLPSVPLGVDLARRGRSQLPAGKDLVLVVASDPPPELGPQPFEFGERERERLLAPFTGETLLLEREEAARDRLLGRKDLLSGARIVHFLTHGTSLALREYSAALVLSSSAAPSERFLVAEDVQRLELGGLVILSACGSGRGPQRTGDDRLVHLGGAFLDAGARCVVLARFPVEYEATLALMERFHERLAAGEPPAVALQGARAQGPRGAGVAGYRLAAFEVLGLGFEPIFGR